VTNESFVCESNLVLTSLCGLNAVLFDSNWDFGGPLCESNGNFDCFLWITPALALKS
jgi:hypothetical protein